MKTVRESVSPPPAPPPLVGSPDFATHFKKGESEHMQLELYSWKSVVKEEKKAAFLLTEWCLM